jgi:hypothetical protein
MKNYTIGLCLAAMLPGCLSAFDDAEELSRAKQATASFALALKSELVAAMQSGGALEAIEVCHTNANAIALQVSQESGMHLSRVSAKNRNPGNAAEEWQLEILNLFEQRKLAGESPATLSWSETVETVEGAEFRFMKAIPTAGLCLQCHGTAIAPDVTEKQAELYPDDKAVGYREGDIRGAFLVTRRLD